MAQIIRNKILRNLFPIFTRNARSEGTAFDPNCRATEDGNVRITESGDIRITEG